MNSPFRSIRFFAVLLLCCAGAARLAAEGGILQFFKQIDYQQTAPDTIQPVGYSCRATFVVASTFQPGRPVPSVTFDGPNGVALTLQLDGSSAYLFTQTFASETELNAVMPDGTYTLRPAGFSVPVTGSFTVTSGAGPTRITNFNALQTWPGYGVRAEWTPIPGGGGNAVDKIEINVADPTGANVFGWTLLGTLDGSATSGYLTTVLPMGRTLPTTLLYSRFSTGWRFSVTFPVQALGNIVVTPAGQPNLASQPYPGGTVDGPAASALINPFAIAIDPSGNIFWTEIFCVRKLTPDGVVSTIAGNPEFSGDAIGAGLNARFDRLSGIATDGAGNIYVTDSYNQSIKKISPAGVVTRIAGSVNVEDAGYADGPPGIARFRFPGGLTIDGAGNVYVADSGNNAIRKITPAGTVSTLAGGNGYGYVDGPGATAQFNGMASLVADSDGTVYVSDGSKAIRRIAPDGTVSTLAKVPVVFDSFSGVDRIGSIRSGPGALAIDRSHNLYFTDGYNVRRIAPNGEISTLAGSGGTGLADGMGANATFTAPTSMAVDARGNVYVADRPCLRKIVLDPSAPIPPIITSFPASQNIGTGRSVVFRAGVSGANLTYQWKFNGVAIAGATLPTLVLRNVPTVPLGTDSLYVLEVTNAGGRAITRAAQLGVFDGASAHLSNLSVRSPAGTVENPLTMGFVVGGLGASGTKPVLLRGIGPALTPLGVSGSLNDPVLTLFRDSTVVSGNDDWGGSSSVAAIFSQLGAFALGATSKDAALYADALAPGKYSAQIYGKNGTGVALAEVYDAAPAASFTDSAPRLINVSALAQVGTGGNILIVGFVTGGQGATSVLIRAVGPGLDAFGVKDALRDPKLEIYSRSTAIASNDNWGGDPQISSVGDLVGAFRLTDAKSGDAALLITLPPGPYTAQVSGVGGTTGVALVEVYEVR